MQRHGEEAALRARQQLHQALTSLGLRPGCTLMVHASLSSIGRVPGGPDTVILALLRTLGEDGTLVMPAATPQCAETPSAQKLPAEPASAEPARHNPPLFNAKTTPTKMGAIAESLRGWDGTLRSQHPLESVCARGPNAALITRDHPLAFSEGPGGPFEKLYELDSWVLLLGVGFNRCTALHFAETLASKRRTTTVRFSQLEDGQRVLVEVPNVADDNDRLFPLIGQRYSTTHAVRQGLLGAAPCRLFPLRELVDFAVTCFEHEL